jgi:hypothetical protein
MLMLCVPKMNSDDVFWFEAQCTREVKVRSFVALDERVGIVMRGKFGASVIETWRTVDVDLIQKTRTSLLRCSQAEKDAPDKTDCTEKHDPLLHWNQCKVDD